MPRIGELSLSGNVRIDGDLNFVGAQSITTTANGKLTILPNGTGIVQIGDAGVTSHTLNTNDDLFVAGKLEVDGVSYFDERMDIINGILLYDDIYLSLGGDGDAKINWETADGNANALVLRLPDGGAINVPIFVIGDAAIANKDLGWFNGQTIPRIAMVAADEGGYFAFGVANDDELDIISTTATIAENDETKFSHKYPVNINGALYYIMLTQT